MSRHHRKLNGKCWEFVRRKVLDATNWRCAVCGRYAYQVDHVRPLHRGGHPYDESNLQALCRTHHVEKTRSENRRHDPARERWRALVAEMMS